MSSRISPRLAWQIIDGEAVLIDLAAGRCLGLNPTGSFVWSLLARQQDENSIADSLAERFAVTREKARTEVGAFLRSLEERGLLVADE